MDFQKLNVSVTKGLKNWKNENDSKPPKVVPQSLLK